MNKPGPSKNSTHVSLGFNLAAGMGLLAFIGYWIDGRRGTEPFWTIVFVILGFIYGAYEVWKFIRDSNDKNNSSS